MNYGLYVSAAGMQAQELRQQVMTNNLANANTTGFKRDLAIMQSRANAVDEDPSMGAYRFPVTEDQGGGVFVAGGSIDLSQGMLEKGDNPTDVALDGKGFFTVQGEKAGEKLLTRDGKFVLSNDGTLVTSGTGRAVLSAEGNPIKLNAALPIAIDGKGVISQGTGDGVQMGLVDVADSSHLIKQGDNFLAVDKPAALTSVSPETRVQQGKLESSGTDPVIEMVNMMEGQRAFEANAKMITFQDTTMSQLNTIGRVA